MTRWSPIARLRRRVKHIKRHADAINEILDDIEKGLKGDDSYAAGLTPKDAIHYFAYSRGTAYRFNRIYRDARKRVSTMLAHRNYGTPGREQKAKHLDHLTSKKRVSPKEKWEWTLEKDGTTTARKKKL